MANVLATGATMENILATGATNNNATKQ